MTKYYFQFVFFKEKICYGRTFVNEKSDLISLKFLELLMFNACNSVYVRRNMDFGVKTSRRH